MFLLAGPGMIPDDPGFGLQDHNYSYPPDIDALRLQCNFLRGKLQEKSEKEKRLSLQVWRAKNSKDSLQEALQKLRQEKVLSTEGMASLERFEGN